MRVLVLLMVAGTMISASIASAADFTATLVIQSRLNDLGFDAGKADGRSGPQTRKALRQFSDSFGGEPDLEGVFDRMRELHFSSREIIDDHDEISEIKSHISVNLRDPESAQVRDLYRVKSTYTYQGLPVEMICGEVNGKNLYGAYVGYTGFFYTSLGSDHKGAAFIDNPDEMFSVLKCLTSFTIDRSD